MAGESPSSSLAGDDAHDRAAARLTATKRRFAEGFDQRAGVLDEIAAAVRPSLGRTD